MKTNIRGYVDRRTPALLEAGRIVEQARLDQAVEARYREAVRRNWKERARVLGMPRAWLSPRSADGIAILKRQAN